MSVTAPTYHATRAAGVELAASADSVRHGLPQQAKARATVWVREGDTLRLLTSTDRIVGAPPAAAMPKKSLTRAEIESGRRLIERDKLGAQIVVLHQKNREAAGTGRKIRVMPPGAIEVPYDSAKGTSGYVVRRQIGDTLKYVVNVIERRGDLATVSTMLEEQRDGVWYLKGVVSRQFTADRREHIMVMEYPDGRRIGTRH